MANELTVPLLPCSSIDEIADFYQALGFRITYRQVRPNPYLAIRREDLQLHFFGIAGFKPEDSYGSYLVYVPDIGELYRAFADGMRARHGKLLVAGVPRMTRPRPRKNSDGLTGFSVIDPGGNWIRIFQAAEAAAPAAQPAGRLARTLQNAVVLADSHGDHHQAARILDSALSRADPTDEVGDLVEALVYRAEVAMVLRDPATVEALLTRIREMELSGDDRQRLAPTLGAADDLAVALHG